MFVSIPLRYADNVEHLPRRPACPLVSIPLRYADTGHHNKQLLVLHQVSIPLRYADNLYTVKDGGSRSLFQFLLGTLITQAAIMNDVARYRFNSS